LKAASVQGSYDDLILKIVKEILTNIFGERTFNKILQIMERDYNLHWREIPRRSKEFSFALRQILGTGSMIIEDLIVETLYSTVGLEILQKKGLSFSDYISRLTSGTCSSRTCS